MGDVDCLCSRAMSALLRLSLFVSAIAMGCSPVVGDECESTFDCSSQGSRLCDRTQPGGYCTIEGCEQGTCPEEAVCVKFRPAVERLSVTYCMAKCDDDDDCRSEDGYQCTGTEDFGAEGDAVVLGRGKQKFCTVPPRLLDSGSDQGGPFVSPDVDGGTGALGRDR
jgi:hypothetical protein